MVLCCCDGCMLVLEGCCTLVNLRHHESAGDYQGTIETLMLFAALVL